MDNRIEIDLFEVFRRRLGNVSSELRPHVIGMIEPPDIETQQPAAMREAKSKVWVLLKEPFKHHTLDHHRRPKGNLEDVAEHSRHRIIGVNTAFERMDE